MGRCKKWEKPAAHVVNGLSWRWKTQSCVAAIVPHLAQPRHHQKLFLEWLEAARRERGYSWQSDNSISHNIGRKNHRAHLAEAFFSDVARVVPIGREGCIGQSRVTDTVSLMFRAFLCFAHSTVFVVSFTRECSSLYIAVHHPSPTLALAPVAHSPPFFYSCVCFCGVVYHRERSWRGEGQCRGCK